MGPRLGGRGKEACEDRFAGIPDRFNEAATW